MPTSFRYSPAVLAMFLLGAAFARPQVSSPAPSGAPAQSSPSIPASEIAQLRPAVIRDLKKLMVVVENNDRVSATDLDGEFQRCTFTPITLGALGPAVLVEGQPGSGAANAGMLNIYLRSNGSYRLIAEGGGFGPRIVAGPAGIPDLVFGWASGVCHAQYNHYRWQNGHYDVDACDQEEESAPGSDDCRITACEGARKLPTFSNPWPAAN